MEILGSTTNHLENRNRYINWLFKKKQDFVILRQFNNPVENITKMYIAMPVRERVFESTTMELFDLNKLDTTDFPIDIKKYKKHETLYSGHIDTYDAIERYLGRFTFTKQTINFDNPRYPKKVKHTLYKDYTCTRQEQEANFSLVPFFTEPEQSVNSIYRLLQNKYVTVVAIEFNHSTNNFKNE